MGGSAAPAASVVAIAGAASSGGITPSTFLSFADYRPQVWAFPGVVAALLAGDQLRRLGGRTRSTGWSRWPTRTRRPPSSRRGSGTPTGRCSGRCEAFRPERLGADRAHALSGAPPRHLPRDLLPDRRLRLQVRSPRRARPRDEPSSGHVRYWPSSEIVRWLGAHAPWAAFGEDEGKPRDVNRRLVAAIIDAFIDSFFTPDAVAVLRSAATSSSRSQRG
jgi:hypothetical protein